MTEDMTLARVAALRGDLALFARTCLKVRTKTGEFVPFEMNSAQLKLHALIEEQKARKGWVRLLVLKGRQAGVSTYIAARFYWLTAMHRGVNTHILAHEQQASDTLFEMVDRFQRGNPIAPRVGASNAKEMEFDKLGSSYSVATAGAKAGGRGKSIMLFHGSEVAFWPNAADHFAASVQAVPLAAGTEIILESTSNGPSGEFYERCNDAAAGSGDYEMVFLPWWITEEYRRDVPEDFVLSSEAPEDEISEAEYAETFDLSLDRMAWRRAKIDELRSVLTFSREYPATAQDAWAASPDHTPYIPALNVLRARKHRSEGAGPLILGVDPASNGGDRFAACARRGLACEWVRTRNRLTHEEAVAWIVRLIEDHRPARVYVDSGNIGANIVSSLRARPGLAAIVHGVNFGGTSQWRLARPKVPGPYNRRAEMWQRMGDWLSDRNMRASIPDDDSLQADLTAPQAKPRLDNFFMLESKIEMRTRGVRSPDKADALALTFANTNEYIADYHTPTPVVSYGSNLQAVPPAPEYDDGRVLDADINPSATSWMD